MTIIDARPPSREDRDTGLLILLQQVWAAPVTTKSDTARVYADEIAEGASRQFLTTAIVPPHCASIFGRLWKLTPQGLAFLYENAEQLAVEELVYTTNHCR